MDKDQVEMSRTERLKQITELQTLSLLPDRETGSFSAALYALACSLRATAKHQFCAGIYFMRTHEDHSKFVIISCKHYL